MKRTPEVVTVCLLSGSGASTTLEPLFASKNRQEISEIRKFLTNEHNEFRRASMAKNARPVVVVDVDRKVHDRYTSIAGRNGLKASVVKSGQTFASAAQASGKIGLRHNEVAMSLSRAHLTGEKTATLRGVTFAYQDDR